MAKVTSSNFCFWLNLFFSLVDNDTDISKTHLNKTEQIFKLDFYFHLQNTENFASSVSSDLFLPNIASKVSCMRFWSIVV